MEWWRPHEAGIVPFIFLGFLYSMILFDDSIIVLVTLFFFPSLCPCPDITDPFIGSVLFVPQMCLPVLYKYWPLPTCMFSSLVIISLLLVILAL